MRPDNKAQSLEVTDISPVCFASKSEWFSWESTADILPLSSDDTDIPCEDGVNAGYQETRVQFSMRCTQK